MNKGWIEHYHLLSVIVNRGRASKVVQVAKANGVPGATITLGWGTVRNRFFDFLGVASEDKDIIFMVSDPETINTAIHALNVELELEKPNHGIAYVVELYETSGVHRVRKSQYEEEEGVETMQHLITVIVDRGMAEEVMESAKGGGAVGGTIINARGSGVHETSRIFNMDVVPEKEIVLILCDVDKSENIMDHIESEMNIHEAGHGIMYLQPVLKSVGVKK